MANKKEKQIRSIMLIYNSYLAYKSTVTLYVEENLLHYQSNFYEEGNWSFDCVYLRDKQMVEQFVSYSSVAFAWESEYGYICIDGFFWRLVIKFSDNSAFECLGHNEKPPGFDEFVDKFEILAGKPLAYKRNSPHAKAFSRAVLLIPNRPDPERDAVADAWEKAGGDVIRVDKFWEPIEHEERNIKIYGDVAFSMVLGSKKNLRLIEPDYYLPITLDRKWLNREIDLTTLGNIRELEYPIFAKPVIPKQFRSGVYNSADELEYECRGLWEYANILYSEVVTFDNEIRCFVLDGQVKTISVYEGKADMEAAKEFANLFASGIKNRRLLVKTYVLDIGYIRGRGWSVIETNPAWGSGLNGCDAGEAIDCIFHATKQKRLIHDVEFDCDDVENILFDGTYEDMSKLRGYEVRYSYERFSSPKGDAMNICVGREGVHMDGPAYLPNCIKYFGYKHDFVDDYT